MSWPWGGRLDCLSYFSPKKLPSLAPPAVAELFPCAPLTKQWYFFGAGKSIGMMRLHPVRFLLPSLFKQFGHILFLYKHRARCDAQVFSMIS